MVSNYLAHSRYNTLTSTAKHLSFHLFSFLFTNKPHKTLTLQREKNFNYPEATIINIWGFFCYQYLNLELWVLLETYCYKIRMCAKSLLSVTLWTVARHTPLSMGFSRQEYWSRLPFPSPGDLPNPGIKPVSFMSNTLAGCSLPLPQPVNCIL